MKVTKVRRTGTNLAKMVAEAGGGDEGGDEHPDIEPRLAGVARGCRSRHAGEEEHGVAGQEEADEQAGLSKDDGGNERHAAGVDETLHVGRVVKILDELEGIHGKRPA
jgi:hypothetical protein